jgi:hypothetical protein
MCKDSKKTLIGQPIFKQILNLISKSVVNCVVVKHQSDRYCKSSKTAGGLTKNTQKVKIKFQMQCKSPFLTVKKTGG